MAQGGDSQTDGRTDGQKISPFYRTLSPIGAAALPPPMKTKEKVEQGKGTADHLMPLGYSLIFEVFLTKLKPTKVKRSEYPKFNKNLQNLKGHVCCVERKQSPYFFPLRNKLFMQNVKYGKM